MFKASKELSVGMQFEVEYTKGARKIMEIEANKNRKNTKDFNKRITVKIDGKDVERHKVCFGLREDKNHKDILHGVNAVYEKQPNGSLVNLTKLNRLTKKQRREQRLAKGA